MKPNRKKENHHFVPQSYLRNWCAADGKMWVHPLDGRSGFRATPQNFATEKGLHDTSDIPELADFDFEGELSTVEGLYSSRWLDFFNDTTNPRTKMNISRFIALFHLRNPIQRETIREVNAGFRALVERVGDQEKIDFITPDGKTLSVRTQDIRNFTTDTPINIKTGFLVQMRTAVEDLAKVLFARKWGVIYAPDSAPVFITSDCPVVLHRGTSTRENFGFRTPGTEITFPISPSKMLKISDRFEQDGLHYPLLRLGDLNEGTVMTAERFIFSARKLENPPDDTGGAG